MCEQFAPRLLQNIATVTSCSHCDTTDNVINQTHHYGLIKHNKLKQAANSLTGAEFHIRRGKQMLKC